MKLVNGHDLTLSVVIYWSTTLYYLGQCPLIVGLQTWRFT